jgi:hypothetical protein
MLTCMTTRFHSATESHSADANPCRESALHSVELAYSYPVHTANASFDEPTFLTAVRFRAQSAASAHRKQQSIPIPLPR